MTPLKLLLGALVLSFSLSAGPINVSYTVTGSSGDWTLDFSVNNNLAGASNQSMYFFGVDLTSTDITATPASFGVDPGTFVTSPFGGSNTVYDDVWGVPVGYGLAVPGTTTSGFEVTTSDITAPAEVGWFAFTFDPTNSTPYTGGGNFNTPQNPGFEGLATQSSTTTPEPSTLPLLGAGLAGICASRRKSKQP